MIMSNLENDWITQFSSLNKVNIVQLKFFLYSSGKFWLSKLFWQLIHIYKHSEFQAIDSGEIFQISLETRKLDFSKLISKNNSENLQKMPQ